MMTEGRDIKQKQTSVLRAQRGEGAFSAEEEEDEKEVC